MSKSNNVLFSGKASAYNFKIKMLAKNNMPFVVKKDGSMCIVDDGLNKYSYSTSDNMLDHKVLMCCKDTKKCATEFVAKNKTKVFYNVSPHFCDDYALEQYVLSGGNRICLIDINHCYWRIAYNEGIVNKNVYMKYRDNKEARTTAIGCFKRPSIYIEYVGTKKIKEVVVNNQLSWLWNYIVYKCNYAMEKVRKKTKGNVFLYHTDGAYVSLEYADLAIEVLKSLNLDSKKIDYEICGFDSKSKYLLSDTTTGEVKSLNMHVSLKVKQKLSLLTNSSHLKQTI